ncbi:MAG: NUDIX domain-containing protein [Brevundimonas sp.]|uniref:NUDIX domain-containing protein n=1 Tax=Brevundimonas sp. TaxID=1871086 RepID=UPI00273335B2|nr:NUDIX domain-containing protein [Brevundimonas sp.]MDP3404633.1 NUDIX domain-containing protein [Brevundimonas sp.]
MTPSLQFGTADPGVLYQLRPAVFGLVVDDGRLACVRVSRDIPYLDLPGGAVDGDESEEQALVREFIEETGMTVRPLDRVAEAGQFFRRSDDAPVNNLAGFWLCEPLSINPESKLESDHELVWLDPLTALAGLRHDAHAWAVATWLRHPSSATIRNTPVPRPLF